MSKQGWIKSKRFTGIFYRESTVRKHRNKPDRTYWIVVRTAGKTRWVKIGRTSEGVTEQYAARRRERILCGAVPAPPPMKITVGTAVEFYTRWAEAEGKYISREIQRYNTHMADAFRNLTIESITAQMLTEHKARLLKVVSPQTAHHCFSFVRRCVNHVIAEELYFGPNPFRSSRTSRFRIPKPQNAGLRYLQPYEAEHLLCELIHRSEQVHDMALLSLRTGMRSTEIFSIKGQSLDSEAGIIWLTAKGGRREPVHTPADVMEILLGYHCEPDDYLFHSRIGGRIKGISNAFRRAVDALGLNEGITDRVHQVWFHTLRHTFASWVAQSGQVTMQELQELMRHERIEMTLRYAHLIPGHQKDKLAIIAQRLSPTEDRRPQSIL